MRSATATRTVPPSEWSSAFTREAKITLADALAAWYRTHGDSFDFADGRATVTWRDRTVVVDVECR